MSEILTKLVVNCETGEQTVVPLTEEELAQREVDAAAFAEAQALREAEQAAIDAARESAVAKLIAVGLTEEEIAALKG
jgi:DNA-binding NarL/FixJ family response regulator